MRKSDIFKTLALGAALAAAWIIPAAGQTPPGLINFQGRLTDSANNPLSGPHDLVFDLYDAPSAGTRLWTEAQNAVPVANGVLAAQLGSVTPVPASVFNAGAVYLQITVDGTPLSPRQRLVSSPYAFNSAALSGRDYTAFVSTDAAAQTVAGDKTFTGVLGAAQLRLAAGVTLAQEPSAALGAGVRVSSNVYIVGFSSAAKYYGDGSALTGVSGSDNLGNHTATKDLDLNGHQIVNVSSLTVSGKDAASGYSLYLSSGLYMPAGTVTAAHLAGDGRGVYGVLASSVAAGAINTAGHFADQVMPLSKLAQSGCAGGQVPKWDGAAWACAADNGGTSYTADEAGLHLAGGVFSALSSSVTLQGNSFNSAGRLVLLDGAGALPAVDGSALVNVNSARFSAVAADTTTIANALAGKLDAGAQAASVANGVYTTGSYSDPSWIKSLSTSKVDLSTVTAALAGKLDSGAQAASVANGVYTTGSYADPSWITSISASKITGSASAAASLAGGAVGDIPYQSAADTTAMLPAGTANYLLQANGAAAPSWTNSPTLGGLTVNGAVSSGGGGTGDLLTINTSNTAGSAGGLLIQSAAAGSAYFRYDRQGAWAGKAYIGNNASTSDNSPSNAITIDGTSGTNRVGIGVDSPAQRLSVKDSVSITNAAGAQYLLMGNQDSYGTNKPFILRGANANLDFGYGDSWASSTGGTDTSYAQFNGNTGGLVVGNSYINVNNPPANGAIFEGPVGLGNAAPDQKLSVSGNISQTGVLISSGTGDNYFAGKVGIGVTGPSYPLQVNGQASAEGYRAAQGVPSSADSSVNGYSFGSDGDTGMFSPGSGAGNGAVAFYSNNVEVMRVAGGSVGIGTSGPSPSAALDVASTSRGLLPPRMTTAQRDAIASPAAGLVVYNTTLAELELYNGTAWVGAGAGFAPGAIAAFAASSCPSGWSEYTAARGRFLRGIDNGAGVDPDGTRLPNSQQADLLRAHSHTITAADVYDPTNAFIINDHSGDQLASSDNINNGVNSELKSGRYGTGSSGGTETRPANVAVIFCQFSGLGSGAAGAGAVLVNGNIWVGNGSNSAVPVSVSGDATLSNAGVLTLASAGSAGTYRSVTTDAKGRVTSGSNPTTFSGYGLSDTSANLAAAISDETGSGALVFANSPAFSGSVGIGTAGPGYKLDVQGGDINASGSLREAGAALSSKYAYAGGGNASGTWGIGISGNAATATKLNSQGNYDNTAPGTTRGPAGLNMFQVYNNGYPTAYGNLIHVTGAGGGQLLIGWSGTDGAHADNYIRSKRDNDTGAWSAWAKLLTDANYNSYAPTLTGGGASGTWGISITGSAGSASNADTVDSLHAASFLRAGAQSPAGNAEVAQAVNSSAYSDAAIELRELNFGGAQTGAIGEAPRISFHWGGRVASQIAMLTDGSIQVRDNPGTGYGTLKAGAIYSNDNAVIHAGNIGSQSVNYANYAGGSSAWNAATTYDYPVAQVLRWKNYGQSHVIFDASNGTAPNGAAIDNTTAQIDWAATYPTLMGWNGSNTYGVRVARAAYAEHAGVTMDCYDTAWSASSGCAQEPSAAHPACNAGYTDVGIAAVTQSDAGCGISSSNYQKVKTRCCRVY